MDRSIQIDTFSRFTQVSRETIVSLNKYEEKLIKANKTLNLIGNSTIKDLWNRHFLDSAQVIDFIDKNDKTLIDIGSGAGFPGLVIAIVLKDRKIPLKGIQMTSPDIRAGVSLLIAALSAEGESTIDNIDQIDRGYSNIDIRLKALGAQIERI